MPKFLSYRIFGIADNDDYTLVLCASKNLSPSLSFYSSP